MNLSSSRAMQKYMYRLPLPTMSCLLCLWVLPISAQSLLESVDPALALRSESIPYEAQDQNVNTITLDMIGGLEPSTISLDLRQTGAKNSLEISVLGSANAIGALQTGFGNKTVAHISGHSNSLAIQQSGTSNHVGTSQIGVRNTISIRQGGF